MNKSLSTVDSFFNLEVFLVIESDKQKSGFAPFLNPLISWGALAPPFPLSTVLLTSTY